MGMKEAYEAAEKSGSPVVKKSTKKKGK